METEYSNIRTSNKTSWTHCFRQVLVCLTIWTSYIITGMSLGTPTVAVPQLRKEANSTAAVTNEMASWLTSVFGYSGASCLFIIIPVAYFMGRKYTMAILAVNTLISSVILYFGKTAVHLLIGQIILGLTFAAQCSVYLLILSEYSSPKYRGVFLSLKSATFYWGMWIANAIGIFTDYRYIGLVGIFCSCYSLIISFIVPESPYWLAFKGRFDECAVAHRWLKGVNEDAEKELDVLIKSQTEIEKKAENISLPKYIINCLKAIREPDVSKPLLLSFLVTSLLHLSGKLASAVYAIEIMKKLIANQAAVYIGVLVLDGFTVLGMYIGCGLSKILKRRALLISTSITGTTFLFALCIYLYLIKLSVLPENEYIIIVMLVGYSMSVCCGPLILSTCISAELLPMRFRSFCVLVYSIYSLILSGTTVKISPYMFNAFGFHGFYLVYGVCSTIIIALIYKYVPETKDRTLHEIADIFINQNTKGRPSQSTRSGSNK